MSKLQFLDFVGLTFFKAKLERLFSTKGELSRAQMLLSKEVDKIKEDLSAHKDNAEVVEEVIATSLNDLSDKCNSLDDVMAHALSNHEDKIMIRASLYWVYESTYAVDGVHMFIRCEKGGIRQGDEVGYARHVNHIARLELGEDYDTIKWRYKGWVTPRKYSPKFVLRLDESKCTDKHDVWEVIMLKYRGYNNLLEYEEFRNEGAKDIINFSRFTNALFVKRNGVRVSNLLKFRITSNDLGFTYANVDS